MVFPDVLFSPHKVLSWLGSLTLQPLAHFTLFPFWDLHHSDDAVQVRVIDGYEWKIDKLVFVLKWLNAICEIQQSGRDVLESYCEDGTYATQRIQTRSLVFCYGWIPYFENLTRYQRPTWILLWRWDIHHPESRQRVRIKDRQVRFVFCYGWVSSYLQNLTHTVSFDVLAFYCEDDTYTTHTSRVHTKRWTYQRGCTYRSYLIVISQGKLTKWNFPCDEW
jgi:hypothetical protein